MLEAERLAGWLPALAAATCLASCATAPPSSPVAHIDEAALVGYWVPEGEHCESDAGVNYSADRTFAAYDISGTWHLSGTRLFTVIRERGGPEDPAVRLRRPERHSAVLSEFSRSKHTARWGDGYVVTLVRCPIPDE